VKNKDLASDSLDHMPLLLAIIADNCCAFAETAVHTGVTFNFKTTNTPVI